MPTDSRTKQCSSCGAPIIWLKTANQANMPVDAANVWIEETKFDSAKHVSHFSTCPNATQHRTRRPPGKARAPESPETELVRLAESYRPLLPEMTKFLANVRQVVDQVAAFAAVGESENAHALALVLSASIEEKAPGLNALIANMDRMAPLLASALIVQAEN